MIKLIHLKEKKTMELNDFPFRGLQKLFNNNTLFYHYNHTHTHTTHTYVYIYIYTHI